MICNAAGLTVKIQPQYSLLKSRLEPYLCADSEKTQADIDINITNSFLLEKQRAYNHLTLSELEYIYTGDAFYRELIMHGGFMLHASAVEYEKRAYLFSAPSGTGKSTHTSLWLDYFKDKARIINDDKPALRFIGDTLYACGTPWSGKTPQSANVSVPLAGIAFIERAKDNYIEKLPPVKALKCILDQTVRSNKADFMDTLLKMMDRLLAKYPVYLLKCNMTQEAVTTAYNTMSAWRD